MKRLFSDAFVIARRDFLATVATPTFIIFLMMPLLMFGISAASGLGAAHIASTSQPVSRAVALLGSNAAEALRASDSALREAAGSSNLPALVILPETADPAKAARKMLSKGQVDTTAVLYGALDRPVIRHSEGNVDAARYLAVIAENATRAKQIGLGADQMLSRPDIAEIRSRSVSNSGQHSSGFGAVTVIFVLTLLLSSQTIGTMAEEKSNKVIEILAAAIPLESVFLGKLIGMFGVALAFIGFWCGLGGIVWSLLPESAAMSQFTPAIGLPLFVTFCAAYFALAFMLLGAVFLGIGAQASTMREIQMMSLPITVFMMGMFGLASAAAGAPGTDLARFAEIFPFSSPFAMAARGATDPAVWPHLLALVWQTFWVGLIILLAARLFRAGVLKSGGGWRSVLGLRR